MLSNFLEDFGNIVGAENVFTDTVSLDSAAMTNYRTSEQIVAIVKPKDASEVSACLKVANQQKMGIYVISKGKNWGYGSRVPLVDACVLIDLGRLDRIVEHSDKYGYVTLEPGVTFEQLFSYLRENNSDLLMSATGGGLQSSILGNAVERGIGTGLYADRFASVCDLEVVMPDGEIINTGFGRFGGNPEIGKLYKWGQGPSLDGLFSQSNFGVVTKLTTWLMKSPEIFQMLFYKVEKLENLYLLMDELRELSMNGFVRPALTFYNDFRVFSTMMQYPFDKCDPDKSTYADVMAELRRSAPHFDKIIGLWSGEISFRSMNEEHDRVQQNIIREKIGKYVDDMTFVSITKDEILEILQNQHKGIPLDYSNNFIRSFLIGKYIGIPNDLPIRQTYWRKRKAIPQHLDPDKDKCGLIWISPVIPFNGNDLKTAVEIISKICDEYHFEPAISLQCLSERAINIIASINWDRDIKHEDENAEKCYLEMLAKLSERGYYPYRNTTFGMKNANYSTSGQSGYNKLLNDLKNTIDPNHILSSGRYNIK